MVAGNPILTAMGGWVYIMANQRNGTLG